MIAFGKDDSLREGWVDGKNWMNPFQGASVEAIQLGREDRGQRLRRERLEVGGEGKGMVG